MNGRTDESTSRPQAAHPAPLEPAPTARSRPPRPPEDRFVYRLTPKALQVLREHEPGAPLGEPVARPVVVELESFEYEYTRTGVRYSAPPGMHDDCVCALALAVRQRTMPTIDPWRWMAEVY